MCQADDQLGVIIANTTLVCKTIAVELDRTGEIPTLACGRSNPDTGSR
ncbi:MAG: hypothetical protein WCP86_01850 [bacterium]